MGKPVEREPKKPYTKPKLTLYGTVRELTHKVGGRGHQDKVGGNPVSNKTSFG